MERRDFLKTLSATPALGLLAGCASTAPDTRGVASAALEAASTSGAAALQPGPDSAAALAELRAAIAEVEAGFSKPSWRLRGDTDYAEARGALMHVLHHAIECWNDSDPERPAFKRFVTPEKKLLGDNPDAVYFTAPVRADRVYRIRGNLAGATYTSLTVELGTGDGKASTGIGAALNDTQFEAAPDGSYEIQVGGSDPGGNWLPLAEGAGSVTTRHYYEREQSVAADRLHHIPILIEPLGSVAPAPPPTDASIAAGFRRVANFLRASVIPPAGAASLPAWFSATPNRFPPPVVDDGNREIGFAAVDNVYLAAPYVVLPDRMLVMRGRFPECRFANVVLWNRFLQTQDYVYRQTSFNRKQVTLDAEGRFEIVLAHRDPGRPNWLDIAGRPVGTIFWRFQLPTSALSPIETEVLSLPA